MRHIFKGKAVSSLIAVVPSEERSFDEEYGNYGISESKARKYKETMGFDRHRVVSAEVTTADLCERAFLALVDSGALKKQEVGALVFITQTPDYFLPPTSNVLQGKLGLGQDVVCMDINQGCAGFVFGMMQAFLLLDIPAIDKVVVLVGDTASKQVSPRNRASYPMVGDGAAAFVVERMAEQSDVYFDCRMDGARYQTLIVPAGAYRQMSSAETLAVRDDESGIPRSLEHIRMDGPAILSFTMSDVLHQIQGCLEFSRKSIDSIEAYIFHQPNRFVLQSMADKLGVARDRLPSNIVGLYGNCSSASIPLNIAHNYRDILLERKMQVCFSGFGVGLTWLTAVMEFGPLRCCEIIEY